MRKLFLTLFSFLTLASAAQDWQKIAMVNTYATADELLADGDDDEIVAWTWLGGQGCNNYIAASQLATADLSGYKCLWIAIDRATGQDASALTELLQDEGFTPESVAALKQWYAGGGNLLLTNHATMAMTWFGRASVYPQNYGSSAGSDNSDIFYAMLTYGKDPNAEHVLVHQETDQLYEYIEKLPTGDRDDTWCIALLGGDYKEDHNCFWHFDTSDFPVKIPYEELDGFCDNGWYEKIGLVSDVYGIDMLATWAHINDFYGGAICRWKPISDDPYGHTEYKGTAITIGIGAYEWNVNSGYNPYQQNIEQLTRNALAELAPTATAIKAVDTARETPCHNLAGQRVGSSYKGLVIKDGKKIFSK